MKRLIECNEISSFINSNKCVTNEFVESSRSFSNYCSISYSVFNLVKLIFLLQSNQNHSIDF